MSSFGLHAPEHGISSCNSAFLFYPAWEQDLSARFGLKFPSLSKMWRLNTCPNASGTARKAGGRGCNLTWAIHISAHSCAIFPHHHPFFPSSIVQAALTWDNSKPLCPPENKRSRLHESLCNPSLWGNSKYYASHYGFTINPHDFQMLFARYSFSSTV